MEESLTLNSSFAEFVNSSLIRNSSLLFQNESSLDEQCNCAAALISDGMTCSCDDKTDDAKPFIPWNNPDNVITRETVLLIEKIVMCYVNLVLLVVGLPTNIVSAVIFYRQGLRDRMNLSLFSLSIVDMFVVLLWFLLGSFCYLGCCMEAAKQDLWKWQVRKYIRGFHRGFYYSSGCLTMIVAVERCICVALPFKAPTLMRARTMGILIITTVLVVHVICSVYLVKFDVKEVLNSVTNKTVVILPDTSVYLSASAFIDTLMNLVIMICIPCFTFCVVSIATLITVVKIKQSMAWRESAASGNAYTKTQASLVKMLIIVSCIYMATSSPNVILGITRFLVPEFWLTGKFANIFVVTHILYVVLGTFNSTVNFFVYVTRSSRFRQEFFRMIPGRKFVKKKENVVSELTLSTIYAPG